MSKDQELTIEIIDDKLVISIGISTLLHAITFREDLFPDEETPKIKIVDENIFAKDVLFELQNEEEDGTTLVHKMFDEAGTNAMEQGSEGIEIHE